ncbi:amino acid adenylation domain-containing protein [Streptomyces sp. NPDC093589]|uniref:amino acid adenylation domain-containing protein n=1 Tax=Streptomyces sp. NPDC093589 TaxID=3366043 RepID=UPI00380A4FCA
MTSTSTTNAPSTTVLDLLELRFAAEDTADGGTRTAVRCAGTDLAWRELDTWSRQVARHLVAHGAGPGSCVPVLAARGGALVAGWLGALRAGAAFVPLALDAPAARIRYVLEETGAASVLVDEAGAELLNGLDAVVKPVALEEIRALSDAPASRAAAEPLGARRPGPEDPAVVIYTSGTTGRPKGVLVPHRGLLNTALWWADDCALDTTDRLLVTAGTAFDPAAFNVVQGLLAGARIVLADDVERRDPAALLRWVHGPEGATVAGSITPSLLHAMLEAADAAGAGPGAPSSLRVVYSGGEPLPRSLATACSRRWGAEVRNVYGPAEASCNSTRAVVVPGDDGSPAIGVPLPNTRAYVLGPHGEELPAGVPGELYVAGTGVALGYLKQPERTTAAFLPDPYAQTPGALMYRTGDRVLVRPDGELEYLGRVDDQVKILGNRIEPNEVRALLEENPAVAAAAVHPAGSPKRLIAYVVLAPGHAPTHEEVVRPLLGWLPAAVLPTEVYAVDALPRTANDKVDFVALAELGGRALARGEQRPAELTGSQRRVARLMALVLAEAGMGAAAPDATAHTGADASIPADGDFFTLGGHSLLAVRLLAAVERAWGTAVPLRVFLAEPTVAGLARFLDRAPDAAQAEPTGAAFDDGRYPASPVQQRLWFMDRLPALRAAYLAPSVVEIDGPVDRALLRDAFAAVLARHPGLRSRFTLDARARRVHYRTDGGPPEVDIVDGTAWTDEELREHLARACWAPVDLAGQAPARGEVIALAGQRTVLLYAVHHIVTDGWSLGLVMSELARTYRALHGERRVPDDLPTAVHPARVPVAPAPHDALDALLGGLRGAPTDITLPYDRPRPAVQTIDADVRGVLLPATVSDRVREIAAELGTTTFMTAAALMAAVLARRGDQRHFLFAFPWAGRDGAQAAGTVGMFVNTLLVRADLTDCPSWLTLLNRVRTSAMTAFRHADAPFDALAAALHPGRDLSRPPVTPVYIDAMDDAPRPPDLGADLATRYVRPPALKLKYELELTAVGGDRIGLQLTYATALFDADTVDTLLGELTAAAADLTTDPEALVLTDTSQNTTPQPAAPEAAATGPDTAELTERVGAAWREVLDVGSVPYDVNFFDAGGDSLLLIVLLEQLSGLTDRELDAADLFHHSTVQAQAVLLAGGAGTATATAAGRAPAATGRARLLGRERRGGEVRA